ncbi:rRNA processing protein Nop9 [Pseudovirgaria hyperparasitica]|uniref:Nucleolar protein 9 n=1 Tax=Pseudovirgaria hyperparasitica TaxID=470096 RepID=A0A6A6W5L2_9PEZI|nr:rRNA processing protein Nop9 [Pseudovirgaria hyperparasitica]KAF2758218.1 rRNA processing protein Nop9 [Pseudovirgaria hyperparasitica]
MPKENKKRGRREEKKRKRDDEDEDVEAVPRTRKSRKSADDAFAVQPSPAATHDVDAAKPTTEENYWVGQLDEEEQEYFRRASEMLELNQFSNPEERMLFLENLHKEVHGKELKIAHSQGCSRLMERLIQLATPAQLKSLFQTFIGNFLNMVQHRFASHCCEAIFIHSAPVVSHEMREGSKTGAPSDPNEVYVTMESLFLYAANELEANLGYLITDRYASHPLRVLLVVLSGMPLEPTSRRTLLHSRKKESNAVALGAENTETVTPEERVVPQHFLDEAQKIIKLSISGLETTYLRALATHQTGNPILQLLLQLELSKFSKSKVAKDGETLFRRLLPDDDFTEGSESERFVKGLIYDPIGSRLVETIVEHAPGKVFKSLYRSYFKDRIAQLARNDVAGYVVCKVLERLSKDDLEEAVKLVIPQIPSLVERNRTSVIKTLIERCVVRDADTASLATALEASYAGSNGFEIARLLKLSEVASESTMSSPPPKASQQHRAPTSMPERLHSSLLAQSMLTVPGTLSDLVFDSLARLSTPLSIALARDPSASRTLQAALKSPSASLIFRRKMIQRFYGHIGEMALDPSASHVIDAVWAGTSGLAFIRERIAEELAENEAALRGSFVGRNVWRNWEMDLYKRRRDTWVKRSRQGAGNDGFMSFPEKNDGAADAKEGTKKHKSALELARERHFLDKKKKDKEEQKKQKIGKEQESQPQPQEASVS